MAVGGGRIGGHRAVERRAHDDRQLHRELELPLEERGLAAHAAERGPGAPGLGPREADLGAAVVPAECGLEPEREAELGRGAREQRVVARHDLSPRRDRDALVRHEPPLGHPVLGHPQRHDAGRTGTRPRWLSTIGASTCSSS